jgi:BirA family transcriptional regulator, biotin operon repressor / biotin---[acetyl-CoA-carboxylase] ligase
VKSVSLSPLGALPPFEGRKFRRIENVIVFPEVSSTNDFARALVERMLADGSDLGVTAILADRQTSGRGRSGRSWQAVPGKSLVLSLVVAWPEGPERVRIPMKMGIRFARVLDRLFGIPVRLKWPNDLLVRRRKLGGILCEARSGDDGEGYVVVGIGLNLALGREELDAAGLPQATSLLLEGVPPASLSGAEVLREVLRLLDDALGETIDDLPEAYLGVTAHALGDPIVVVQGAKSVEGLFQGVTADGFLRLLTPSGTETCLSGEISRF